MSGTLPRLAAIAEEQVRKRVPSRYCGVICVEGQVTGNRAGAQFATKFILLAEEPNREIAFGTLVAAPRGWRPRGPVPPLCRPSGYPAFPCGGSPERSLPRLKRRTVPFIRAAKPTEPPKQP